MMRQIREDDSNTHRGHKVSEEADALPALWRTHARGLALAPVRPKEGPEVSDGDFKHTSWIWTTLST